MLAAHGVELARLAEMKGVALAFEAAVGGGVPVIKTLREGLAGNAVRRVCGILNGTCNYILSRMETEGLPFEVCLAEAQKLGYAEADPTFDVGGFDTAHKLAILASLAFGTRIDADAVSVEGIETITLADLAAADELGFRIKLLGVAERTQARRRAARASRRWSPSPSRSRRPWACSTPSRSTATRVGSLTLVGPGRRRRRDRLRGRRRHRRYRARHRRSRVRPPGRHPGRGRARLDAAPRGRLLRAPVRGRPPRRDGGDRHPHGRAARSRSKRSCRSARSRTRRRAPMSRSC